MNNVKNFMEDTKKKLIAQRMGEKMMSNLPTTDMGMKEGRLRAEAEKMLGPKPTYPTTDMGIQRGQAMSKLLEQLRKKNEINFGSKLENEQRLNQQYRRPVDMPQKMNYPYPDWMKPQFRINSLDRQNNDPLKTGSLDSFRGNTDIKPIPSATFSGSVSKIPNLTPQ
jgi:hypothetical protein